MSIFIILFCIIHCWWYTGPTRLKAVMASSVIAEKSTTTFHLAHAVHIGGQQYPGLRLGYDFRVNQYNPHFLLESRYPVAELHVKSTRRRIWRPSHSAPSEVYTAARHAQRGQSYQSVQAPQLTWAQVEVDAPDVSDVETLATLAKMANNAYSTPRDGSWYDLKNHTINGKTPWNLSASFGWEEDGIRGHVFASSDDAKNIIIAIKGTSGFSGGIGAPTGRNDKLNDNLLFSCCCARVDWSWSTVCDCYVGSPFKCNLTCVEDSLIEKSVYYPAATDLFNNITARFPTSQIWLTGHSLGGSLASLLSITFGVPCVTFEAPGDVMPARRLHLPLPPGTSWDGDRPEFGVTHVYTNSDPIPMGVVSQIFDSLGHGSRYSDALHEFLSVQGRSLRAVWWASHWNRAVTRVKQYFTMLLTNSGGTLMYARIESGLSSRSSSSLIGMLKQLHQKMNAT